MLKPNKLRQKLTEGHVVHGTLLYSWAANVVDVAAYSGLDFVWLDNEHAWRQDQSTELLIRAAVGAGISTILRVDKGDPYLIRKALEIGADAVLVPEIVNIAEVKAVINAAKFPLNGERGFNPFCYSGGWGIANIQEWIAWSNRESMVGIMIERPEIMNQIDMVLNLEGLDFVVFGSDDFSLNLGFDEPKPDCPEVQDALLRTIASAKKAGKHVLHLVDLSLESQKKYKDLGVTMMSHGSDLVALHTAWKNIAKED